MIDSANGSKKTSTITFRLDDGTINRLRDLSHVQEVSTNTLVNQALRKFIDWDVFLPKSGFVMLTKPVVKKIFDGMDKQFLIELASKMGKEENEDIVLFMRGKVDQRSFLSRYETMILNSSVEICHMFDDGVHNMVLKHDLGRNWALYQKTILELVFKDVLQKNIEIEYDNNTMHVVFTADESSI